MNTEIFVENKPKNCMICDFSRVYTSEPDPYGSLHFQNDQWLTYTECILQKQDISRARNTCPLKVR